MVNNSNQVFQTFLNNKVADANISGYQTGADGAKYYMGIEQFKQANFADNSPKSYKDLIAILKDKNSKERKLVAKLVTIGYTAAAIFILYKNGSLSNFKRAMKNEFGKFNQNLVLDNIPSSACLQDRMKDKFKNVALDLAFDETNVNKTLVEEKFGKIFSDWMVTKDFNFDNLVANDKNKTRALNLLMGFYDDASMPSYRKPYNREVQEFIANLPKDFDIEAFETLLKSKKANAEATALNGLTLSDITDNYKRLLDLDGIMDIFKEKMPKHLKDSKDSFNIWRIVRTSSKTEDIDEIKKILQTVKVGTLDRENSLYSLGRILTYGDDLVKVRKFYASIEPHAAPKVLFSNLEDLLEIEDMKSVEVSNYINNMTKAQLKKIKPHELPKYINFRDFIGVSNINELDMAGKRILLRKLTRANSSTFGNNKFAPVMPKNKTEYCALLNKLAKSIGVDTKPLDSKQVQKFEQALGSLTENIRHVDLDKTNITLAFSREDFINEANGIMKGLSELEKRKVMDYFGFEIGENGLKGYPINVNNGEKLAEISDKNTQKVVNKLRVVVEKFTNPQQNPVIVSGANQQFEQELNALLEGLPELRTMIGKAQHSTHAYTLDKHTLKVFQEVCANPKFAQLSESDKKALSIASLLHDITKLEGKRDYMHPIESAYDAYYIIQKFNLREDEQLKIYELIRSHNWLQRLNDKNISKEMVENIAQDIAFDSRQTNTFELAKMLCEADTKSVKTDASFYEHFKPTLDEMSAKVDGYLKRIKETQIFLPQTKIPHASELVGGVEKTAGGITNKVIYLENAPDDLSKLGFEAGTTKQNMTNLVHALDFSEQMSKFDTFSAIDTEALLSSSFMNPREYQVFRKQGVILNVNTNDIHAGYYRDFGTGYSKEIELLKTDYLFNGSRKDLMGVAGKDRTMYRDYISKLVKDKLGLSDEEYIKCIERIQGCQSITDVEKVDETFAKSLSDVFASMDAGKRNGGRKYNEMLVSRPRVQGVFAYDKKYEDIPEFLRKYAQDNDMPIIIFGKPRI